MENPLHEAHEEIEHLEHLPASRLKIIITVSILLVTMLATLAGVMAAIWSAKQSEAQRSRQQATAESLKSSLEATSQQSTSDQALDDLSEAAWRSAFLNVDSLEVTDSTVSAALRAQADAAATVQKTVQASLPAGADGPGYSAKLRQPALISEQLAKADAQESVGWLGKNNGALAVVSMLALSLFLLGLALTISNRPTQVGFTVLAIVMTVVAGARLGQIAADPIVVASESCIDQYGEAVTDADSGESDKAGASLESAVNQCSHFEAAWTALGQVRFGNGQGKSLDSAQAAFQKALDVADAKSPDLYNNLGYVETLNKDFDAAEANLDRAAELAPENQIIMASRAELAIARGDRTAADRYLDDALEAIAKLGPYFRNEFFFASLRSDRQDFARAGLKGAAIDEFFLKGREAEASLDALGKPEPGDTHGGRISGLILRKSQTKLGEIADFVTLGFTHHGVRAGDHISVRFYANDQTYDLTASIPNSVVSADNTLTVDGVEEPDSHFRLGLSNKGETTMEVYLNGVSQGAVSITI